MRSLGLLLTMLCCLDVRAAAPDVPIAPGVTFVLAVTNARPPEERGPIKGIVQGDYEMPVVISEVDEKGITQTAFWDGVDEKGEHQRSSMSRRVRQQDLADSHLQIFGFHAADPQTVQGATSLGPSLAITRALASGATTAYSMRNFVAGDTASGTLARKASSVKFPVLLNGKRVELDAIHATGIMAAGKKEFSFEMLILDHPRYPLSLRIAWGESIAALSSKPSFAREIVRIDFPQEQTSLAESLNRDCRVEVPGIYFDFNQATLKPQSQRALKEIAAALLQSTGRAVRVEGHTDNVGTDAYNADLSSRRAAAVKAALVSDFNVDGRTLSTEGYGESKPKESNDTIAGRARNRRVELACAGAQ